jgi:MFS family permease
LSPAPPTMHMKVVLLLMVALCAALARTQEVRVIYDMDVDNTNGTQYTPVFNGDLTPEQQEYFDLAWGIAFIVFGLVFVVFGYRIFRITLFIIGAIAGAATAYLLLQTHAQLALFLVLIIAGASGIILGLMFVCIFYLGLFALGAMLGCVLAGIVLATPLGTSLVTLAWVHWLVLVGSSALFGILALVFQKPLLIVATSIYGAYLIAFAVAALWVPQSNFAQIIPHLFNAKDFPFNPTASNWLPFVFIAGIAVVAILGIVVQARVTARKYHHLKKKYDDDNSVEVEPLLKKRSVNNV